MYKGGWGCCSFMLIDKLGFQFISSTFTFNQYCKEKKKNNNNDNKEDDNDDKDDHDKNYTCPLKKTWERTRCHLYFVYVI